MNVVADVLTLVIEDSVRVDPEGMSALHRQLGAQGAEDVVCRAIEELAVRLAKCERMWRQGDLSELRKNARSLIAIAEQIGLSTLAGVAEDVTRTLDSADNPATDATLARLIRIGERSLTLVWDIRDLSV